MWVATVPPPTTRPLPCTIRSSPSISTSTPFAARPSATALSRSDSFTRNSFSPRMTVVPWAKLAATAAQIKRFDIGAHFPKRDHQTGAERIGHHVGQDHLRARHEQCRDEGKG